MVIIRYPEKFPHICKLNNRLLKICESKRFAQGNLKNTLTDDNENTIYQDLWDEAKEMVRENFTALMFILENKKSYKINARSFCLKKLEKEDQIKP